MSWRAILAESTNGENLSFSGNRFSRDTKCQSSTRRDFGQVFGETLSGNIADGAKRKLLEFLDRLLRVIESRKIYPFASGVLRSEWDKHDLEWRRVWTGATREHPSGAPSKPIFMAFVTNVISITRYCKPGIVVNFVFDQNKQAEGWAHFCYAGLKTIDRSLTRRLGELSFADSEKAVQLQASDLIAYEAHLWAREASGDKNRPMRRVYERCLRNARSRDDFWMFDAARFAHMRHIAKVLYHPVTAGQG